MEKFLPQRHAIESFDYFFKNFGSGEQKRKGPFKCSSLKFLDFPSDTLAVCGYVH